jgi:hypothetical protein
MNPRLARLLALMYPGSWRKRYGAEFKELLESGRGGFRTVANVVWSGLHERICPTVGFSPAQVIGSGLLHSLCARAPWAIFSLAPVSLLAGFYIAACLILRIGWAIFLPERDTPFGAGPVYGLANLYFQFGKYFYGSAPILVGWVVAILAVRHRAKAIWPSTGFVLVAWMGAAARIRASRTEIPRGLGHVRMDFVLWPWAQNGHDSFVYALVILLLAVLPYLLWQIHSARTMSS